MTGASSLRHDQFEMLKRIATIKLILLLANRVKRVYIPPTPDLFLTEMAIFWI